MSNSSLINYTILSPNYSTRTLPITKITIHHAAMVGVDSQRIAKVFTPTSRGASCNYAIGVNGDITLVVPEEYRAWTSGTWTENGHDNDGMAVTMEVANCAGEPDWKISDATMESIIKLCTDICQRNNISNLNFTGNANGNLTMHCYFAATRCPGEYLKTKFQYIADEVNKRLGGTYIPAEPVDTVYSAYTTEWLGEIINYNEIDYSGYAGWEGRPMTGIRAKLSKGNIVYRAHTQQHGWLNWITNLEGYGYAGMYGTPIDGVQMKIEGLGDNYHVEYRTHVLGGDWLSWIKDCGDGDYGYSGLYGNQLDMIQIRVIGESTYIPPIPKEEEKEEPIKEQIYRIRLTWEDSKSQKGAYKNLESAKSVADQNPGYSVFDEHGNIIYTSLTVEAPSAEEKEEPKAETIKPEANIPAYDLDYPEKHLIVDKSISRNNEDCVKVIKAIKSTNNKFDVEIAKVFFKLAPKYSIDPMMAMAQSILETGWFKYNGSAVKPSQYNYCGLGVTSNGMEGNGFGSIENGVTAQYQHLYAYGCKDTLNEEIIDPRYQYVTKGIAPYWEQLAGRWAVPGYDKSVYSNAEAAMAAGMTYGQKIRKIYNELMAMTVSSEDMELYFPTPKEEPEIVEPEIIEPTPVDPEPVEPQKEENFWIKLIKSILEAILKVLKNER